MSAVSRRSLTKYVTSDPLWTAQMGCTATCWLTLVRLRQASLRIPLYIALVLMLVSPVSNSLTTATLLSPHLHPQAASTLSPALRVSNGHIRAALLVLAAKNYLGLLADMKDLVEAAYSSAPDADVIRSVRRWKRLP